MGKHRPVLNFKPQRTNDAGQAPAESPQHPPHENKLPSGGNRRRRKSRSVSPIKFVEPEETAVPSPVTSPPTSSAPLPQPATGPALFHASVRPVEVGDTVIGGSSVCLMAGPRFVDSVMQIKAIAEALSRMKVRFLRARAWWPGARGADFERHLLSGLEVLSGAAREYGLHLVSEIVSAAHIPMMLRHCDMLEIGPANATNIKLLTELSYADKAVVFYRPPEMSLSHFLGMLEHLQKGRCCQIVLAEGGMPNVAGEPRNVLDLVTVLRLRADTRCPVIVDCSALAPDWQHSDLAAIAAIAAGADGIITEFAPGRSPDEKAPLFNQLDVERMMSTASALKHTINALVRQRYEPEAR